MKPILKFFLTAFIFLTYKPSLAVHIDSLYLYSNYYSADSSTIYLVASVSVSSRPCSVESIAIDNTTNITTLTVCYNGGVIATTCPRVDTFNLGVKHNGETNVLAIFQELYNGQCRGDNFFKDSFDLDINTDYTDIASPSSLNGLVISTNPTNYKLNCTIDKPAQNTRLQIFTTAGRAAAPAMPVTQANTEIDVSTLPAGLYFLQLQDDKQRVVKKFVKY
jgi:hypothetical protein